MDLKFLRWIFLISTFFFIATCPTHAQNVIINQKGISIDENLDPNFKQLYLVFAGPYPASPSSAFGHLFLLVEPSDNKSSNPQLWRAINYSADVEDYSGISKLYNGLIGNLEGSFEELPFYKKIRDYSYAESRDLWLFPIRLNKAEKNRFSEYINDRRDSVSQYRFSDKNCATRVNEVLHYTFNEPYSEQFFVLPQDVLSNDIISQKLSQPFGIENVEGQLSDLIEKYDEKALSNIEIDSLNATEKVHLLKSFEWLYNNKVRILDADKKEFIRRLRFEVAQEETNYQFQNLEQKRFDIHEPTRLGIKYIYNNYSLNNLLLDFRLGLHSFGDNAFTYPKYDYIDVFRIQAMFSASQVMLDEFWIFNQSSRQPKTKINSPLSWTLGLGGDRFFYEEESLMALGLYSAVGNTFSIVDNHWTSSFMIFFNPTYLEKKTWSVIVNPIVENRIFALPKVKGLIEISNPIFLQSKELFQPKLRFKGIYSITDNIYINNTVELQSYKLRILVGVNFNLSM